MSENLMIWAATYTLADIALLRRFLQLLTGLLIHKNDQQKYQNMVPTMKIILFYYVITFLCKERKKPVRSSKLS